MAVQSQSVVCFKCSRSGTLTCAKCQRHTCNLHFCDVCRNCTNDCTCWLRPGSVYHPPPDEAPPR